MVTIYHLIILSIALIVLVKGSDVFINSSASLAKKFGVSNFVIGLTLVAFGTSVPELASSVASSLQKSNGLLLGNITGSNIANICLIIAIGALIKPINTTEEILKRDGYVMVFTTLLFGLFISNQKISTFEVIIFLIIYISYISFLIGSKSNIERKQHFSSFINYLFRFSYIWSLKNKFKLLKSKIDFDEHKKRIKEYVDRNFVKDIFFILLGLILIVSGSKFLIQESLYFANFFKIPEVLIGFTLLAVGTSLPELFVTIKSVRSGYGDIAIGNIIGSNIVNIILIIGVSGLIHPIVASKTMIYIIMPFMVFIGLILLLFIKTSWKIGRIESAVLLLLYISIFFVFNISI